MLTTETPPIPDIDVHKTENSAELLVDRYIGNTDVFCKV